MKCKHAETQPSRNNAMQGIKFPVSWASKVICLNVGPFCSSHSCNICSCSRQSKKRPTIRDLPVSFWLIVSPTTTVLLACLLACLFACCLVLSCLVLSCLVLSCLVLSCFLAFLLSCFLAFLLVWSGSAFAGNMVGKVWPHLNYVNVVLNPQKASA